MANANRHPALAARTREARKRLGVPQEEVARRWRSPRSGKPMTAGYLAQVERGWKRPTAEALETLALALDVTYTELAEAAGYQSVAGEEEIPPGVLAVVRRLVRRGLGVAAFEGFEAMAARMLSGQQDGGGTGTAEQQAEREGKRKFHRAFGSGDG